MRKKRKAKELSSSRLARLLAILARRTTRRSSSFRKSMTPFLASFPTAIPARGTRDQAHLALMDAELQRALVDYEESQTHPLGSEPRNQLLDQARESFQGVYNRYRTQLAGFFAHMWEGKCFEEKGELGAAMGVYNELMEHPDPALAPLKRKVMYFQIIVDGKRGDHLLAADRAVAWLQQFPNAAGTDEGIGVRFELSKNLLLQAEKSSGDDKLQMTNQALDLLTDVVRYYSPFKPQAIELLKKYRPAAALNANAISNLSYQDAFDQAQAAIATREWDRASALLQQAVQRADPAKDPERANEARYLLAYCEFEAGRFYESAVLAEHLARRYPKSGQSAQATEIGMAAWTNAYNTLGGVDRQSDLENLVDLARYTTETFSGHGARRRLAGRAGRDRTWPGPVSGRRHGLRRSQGGIAPLPRFPGQSRRCALAARAASQESG